jgi:hypothetical protein
VHELPEATEAQRKVKKQALADYATYSAHAGLVRSTDPDAYDELLDKIAYGDISGPDAVMQLKADPLAIKVAKRDLDNLVNDLKGASIVTAPELQTAFRWALGSDDGPYAKPLNPAQRKLFLEFTDWARRQAQETNRAKDPEYVNQLARHFFKGGERRGNYSFDTSGLGYGLDKVYGESLADPDWLPDLTGDRKTEIDKLFNANPEWAKKEMEKGGITDMEIAKRVYYKHLLEQGIGRRQRPQGAEQ